jgi:hypothetical protein
MENKQIDLDNLTKEDFIEMARYVHSMELQVQELKAYCITLATQRNSAEKKINEINESIYSPLVYNTAIDTEIELVNPEQYRVKKQF